MSEQEPSVQELYTEAFSSVYALINGEKITQEQILHLGMFFGEVSRLIKTPEGWFNDPNQRRKP